jgi:hypothetical protein
VETGHRVDKRGIGIVTHLVILKDEDGEIWEGQEDRASKLNTGMWLELILFWLFNVRHVGFGTWKEEMIQIPLQIETT